VTTTTPDRAAEHKTRVRSLPTLRPSGRSTRRRDVPWIVLGVFLVVGFALTFAVVSLATNHVTRVLALTRSVTTGHVLRTSDLTEVGISAGPGVASVSATSESSVVGRPVAVPLAAGALLTPSAVGAPRSLTSGDAVVGLALKPGQFPPGLTSGDQVRVVDTGNTAAGSSATVAPPVAPPASGVILNVAPSTAGDGSAILSLRVADGDANAVALLASADDVALILLPAGS
jgi:hypothetical protein